ncbi:type I restriction enzyme HsdR N-terminal domain-containing protein [Candidatus Sumerlaeota bacterium]|nr:type I restriction enzyme HsdR N-terminal domain-containing protein [Candidatus Sumerlaeota bacterium]
MFDSFDFEALNDPEFKEDSVREELLVPIIQGLGYKVTGDSRVVRSRNLIHPYVALGSQQRKVSIVPDYLFLSQGKPFWVLDAKAPTEDILKSKHVEQAYSYAIHPEVRADLFALCNGHRFVLFSTRQFEPLLDFELKEIDACWEKLIRVLHPDVMAHPESIQYQPDYGLHLKRLGAEPGFRLILHAVNSNFICKVRDGLYTASTVIPAEDDFATSLDFGDKQLKQLFTVLPSDQVQLLRQGLTSQPYMVHLDDSDFQFGAVADLTKEVIHNAEESYIPFQVQEFIKYIEFCEE